MSSEQDQIRSIAERIARRLSEDATPHSEDNNSSGEDLNALRAALAELQNRLAHVESHLSHDETCDAAHGTNAAHAGRGEGRVQGHGSGSATAARPMWLSGTYVPAVHPSEERFEVGEAVSELVDYFEREKTCNMEPGGKPCDHCGMCSSRGF